MSEASRRLMGTGPWEAAARRAARASLLPILFFGAVGSAAAQNMPPAQVGGETTAPVEIIAVTEGSRTRCEPAEARLPAGDAIDLRIVNRSSLDLSFGAPELLKDQNLVRHEGDLAHMAGNTGYTVKQNGVARVIVRTPQPGQYAYTCANVRHYGEPFKGMLTVVPKAQ
jgi:uncharacterized cupredoxin-like copper-binding protein